MSSPTIKQPFFGWSVVAATFVLAVFGWGVGFYGPPVYLQAVVSRTGWPVALVSAAVTLHFLIGAVVVANLPRLYGRFGVAAVTGTGAVFLALGVCGWSVAAQPWQLFAAAAMSGIGWVAMGAAAVNAILSPWFARRRPAALSMAYNGASIGGVVFQPLWVALILPLGFTGAAIVVGVVMVVTVVALSALVLTQSPEKRGETVDGEAIPAATAAIVSGDPGLLPGSALWRDWRFLTLAAGMALGLFAQIGLLAHLFSLLVPVIGAQRAGLVMGAATVAAIAGRTLVGWIMPPSADRRVVAAASYGVQIAGSLTLLLAGTENVAAMIAGVILFGAGIGNATSLPPLIAQREFSKADVARVVPLIVATSQASYAFAPAGFGLLRTFSSELGAIGGGPLLFVVAACVQCAAVASFLAGRRTVQR